MTSQTSLSGLIGGAGLDAGATSLMGLTADTLGPAIMAGLGSVGLDQVKSSSVLLVTLLVDDSGSIAAAGNEQLIRDGHNSLVEALGGSKQAGDVLISCRYLNPDPPTDQGVLYPYRPLDGALKLDGYNYNANGGTPLYDQTMVMLTGVAAKIAEFENGGVAARAVTVIVTDGYDQHSRRFSAHDVKVTAEGLLGTEQHIIAAMGIDDGHTDFRRVFGEMGIPDNWILTPANNSSEIRRAFAVISQSAVTASQAAGSFSKVAMGGFGS